MTVELLKQPEQSNTTNPEVGHNVEPLSAAELRDAITEAAYDSSTERAMIWASHTADENDYEQLGLEEYQSGKSSGFRHTTKGFTDHPDEAIAHGARRRLQRWEETDFPKSQELALTYEATKKLQDLLGKNLWNGDGNNSLPVEESTKIALNKLVDERNIGDMQHDQKKEAIAARALDLLQGLIDNPDIGRDMATAHRERDADPTYTKFDF